MKHILITLAVLIVAFSSVFLAATRKTLTPLAGEEWLSWKPEQRNAWADGYVAGYLRGAGDGCRKAESLAPNPNAQPREHKNQPSEYLSVRCWEKLDKFDRATGVRDGLLPVTFHEDYVPVITEFYSAHPETLDIQYQELMQLLKEPSTRTADDLVQRTKGHRMLRK